MIRAGPEKVSEFSLSSLSVWGAFNHFYDEKGGDYDSLNCFAAATLKVMHFCMTP